MQLIKTDIPDLMILETTPHGDERGWFARYLDLDILKNSGIAFEPLQISQSHNADKGTLRGLHFQHPPHAETKIVRCLKGAAFDVAVDLRPDSPTRHQWYGIEISEENKRAFIIPKGFAHGFVTLSEDTDLLYMTDHPWTKDAEDGLMWDDPKIGIEWPVEPQVLSQRDRAHKYLS